LTNAVMQALADNPLVHADEIAVDDRSGDIVLRGTVGSLVQRAEAARTTRAVPGVQNVEDELRVRPLATDGRADADTEAAVLAAFIDDDEVPAPGPPTRESSIPPRSRRRSARSPDSAA
jgi:BON domain-containing protein